MTEKDRPEFHDEFSEAEFFALPNPTSQKRFPTHNVLAVHRIRTCSGWLKQPVEARDAEVSQHLTCCSPCFNRYMEILANLKRRSVSGAGS